MSIQQSINQAATIGAALYTQTEAAAEKKEKKALTREAKNIRKGARAIIESGADLKGEAMQRQIDLMKENISQRLKHGLIDDPEKVKKAADILDTEFSTSNNATKTDNDELEATKQALYQEQDYSNSLKERLKDAEERYKSIKQYKQDVKESVNSYRSLLGLPPKEVK